MTSAFAQLDRIRTAEAGPRAPREFPRSGAQSIGSTLAGKTVFLNFWTHSCINWRRTLRYVRAWAPKYQQQLVGVGVDTSWIGNSRSS